MKAVRLHRFPPLHRLQATASGEEAAPLSAEAYQQGWDSGHSDGFAEGVANGETAGFKQGYAAGQAQGEAEARLAAMARFDDRAASWNKFFIMFSEPLTTISWHCVRKWSSWWPRWPNRLSAVS